MLSDEAHYHHRLSFDIFEGMTRKHDTKEYQKAIVMAFAFLGLSCFRGFPMEAICGGCLFDDAQVDPEIQFPLRN